MGGSSRYLAIWLSELKMCEPASWLRLLLVVLCDGAICIRMPCHASICCHKDVCLHENTALFNQEVFERYLGDIYDLHTFKKPNNQDKPALVCPSQFGWPCMRPRLISILIHREKCQFDRYATSRLDLLKRSIETHADIFMCAPDDF